MTPVARAALAFVLVAGAGPAGFLIYHTVFDSHPLHPQASAPESLGSGPGSSAAAGDASAPDSAPLQPHTTGSPGEQTNPTTPPTQTTGTRGPPLRLPESVALPDSNGTLHHLAEYLRPASGAELLGDLV